MIKPIPADRLARRCDPSAFEFATTADLPELDEIVGQDRAVEAVAFGIGIRQPGYNLYAMGLTGLVALAERAREYAVLQPMAEPKPGAPRAGARARARRRSPAK